MNDRVAALTCDAYGANITVALHPQAAVAASGDDVPASVLRDGPLLLDLLTVELRARANCNAAKVGDAR